MEKGDKKPLVIVAITPQFLQRGALWFSQEEANIERAIRGKKDMWDRAGLVIKEKETIPLTQIVRKITELGYEKSSHIFGKGMYATRGNIIEISPINKSERYSIELYGNTIEEIRALPLEAQQTRIRRKHELFMPRDYVVHLDHGIGIYREIKTLPGKNETYFEIEYAAPRENAKPDMLYVPLSQKKKLELYIGFETPTIHRLGGAVWFNTKKKAREQIEKFARELLTLYGKRAITEQIPMHGEKEIEENFSKAFPYQETVDQTKAISDVLTDLEKEKPMDRVLAGDVGFGKTEVAMRAILRVAINGGQTLFLAPTTVLVEEHFRTLRERFSESPVHIEKLSRLTHPKKVNEIIQNFKNGSVDCLIGTHRLLSEDIISAIQEHTGDGMAKKGRGLCLLIIDEEQRFGVRQKEKIKELRANIHILSISATPIPRTLSLALSHLRDISIIKTPPHGRIPIQTIVLPYRDTLVRDALRTEIERKGQVFFLHNRVETLELFKKRLQKLVPKARIECIHGKSNPEILLKVLKDFRSGTIDILLATTIIENGIDFPNANTLIVEDATRLGLAEAHQLRGRIGRGDRESYAYFLYRSRHLTEKALLRLQALQDASELGSGYNIALKDLEIRGSGNVLGKEQSGVANKIGLNLYYHMLSEVIEKVK